MRIIPKNSKMKNTVWKSYSIKDIIVAFALLVFVLLICISNIKGKFIIAAVFALVSVTLFMPTGYNSLFYTEALQAVKYACSQKKFSQGKDIDKLMPFKSIDGEGIIGYDGYYGCVIGVGQKEFVIEDEYQQDIDINNLAAALKFLDESQSADIVKIDRPVNLDVYTAAIWDKMHSIDESDFTRKKIKELIFRSRLEQLDAINNVDKIFCPYYYIVVYDAEMDSLKQCVGAFMDTLAAIGLNPARLDDKETAVFLKYSFTRNFDEREIENIEPKDYIDWIKPHSIAFKSLRYKIDDVDCFTYAIGDYPRAVGNAWGARLFDIDNTKVVMQIRPVEQFKAIRRVDRAVNELASKSDVMKASQALEQDTHIESMGALLENLQNDNESLYDVVTTVTKFCYDKKSDVAAERRKLRQELSTQGFVANNLFNRQIDGFIAANISKRAKLPTAERGINSTSLAAVFPFVHTNIMEEGGALLGAYNDYPFILDIWKRSADYTNSNGMIIGKPGGGKSFFSKLLLSHQWADGAACFVLDPEAEYLALAKNVGGTVIDVGNAREGKMNPFHLYDVLTETGEKADPAVVFGSHLKFLESFYKTVMPECDADVLELINNATVEMYEARGINEYTDCSNYKPKDFPIFEDLYALINDRLAQEENILFRNNLLRAQMYLKKFASGGRYADIWNAPSTLLTTSDFVVFNFQSLFANKNQIVANAQMLLLFRFLEQQIINIREANNASGTVRHIMVFADEAHLFIDKNCPTAVNFFYQMNKRIRKYYGSFIPTTQNISDWNATEDLRDKTSVIIKNSQYNFIFGLSKMDMQDLISVFGGAGSFNEEEAYLITSASRGQTFFMGSAKQRAVCHIVAHDFIRALFERNITQEFKEVFGNESYRNC